MVSTVLAVLLSTAINGVSYAQVDSLPFRISEEKKLSAEKLAKKKEGFYVTGLPRFAYDPIQGIGAESTLKFSITAIATTPFLVTHRTDKNTR